ncbi:D-Ala-D-Ala carboxypeptidase family metallohydrolase [Pseudahrensia aquimaris]|uniref:D-Ala-D-Ala carboxypeptidase family metallohydrolase n=1 Tax=Pseudahrensia aquimaris TaxID=744461 RepID=A0ABW3FG53_9HYPH
MFRMKHVCQVMVAFACIFLTACSQTATSTYGAKGSTASVENARQKKILASRERARKAKEARRAAFTKKREQRKAKRASSQRGTTAVQRKRASRSKSGSKRTTLFGSFKKKEVAKKTKSKKRVASKGRKQRIKRTKKAFVPSVSRKAGRLRVNAPWNCVPKRLKGVIYQIRKRWGPVTINSTHRSHRHNRRVGGKRRSYHLKCQAVDFRVHGSTRGLLTWLKRHPSVGGYKRYRSGFFHIDTGPKRTW